MTVAAEHLSVRVVVDPAEEVLAGHFPGMPVYPGACVLADIHRVVVAWAKDRSCVLEQTSIDSARFLRPVLPGDEITVAVEVVSDGAHRSCRATVSTTRGTAVLATMGYRARSAA